MYITLDQLLAMKPCDRSSRIDMFKGIDKMDVATAFERGATVRDVLWVAGRLGLKRECVQIAVFAARQVMHLNTDSRVVAAIDAAQAWLDNPSDADAAAYAYAAYAAAYDAAAYAYAAYAADAAAAAARAAYAYAAYAAADAAADAAAAAAAAAYAYAAYAAYAAADAAADAAAAAAAAAADAIKQEMIGIFNNVLISPLALG